MTEKGKLTGWHVLIMFGIFFGIMIAVNVVFTVFAVTSFPGEQVEKSYVQGLKFNESLREKERQAALGWRAEIGFETTEAGGPRLVSNWFDGADVPLVQLTVTAVIIREVSDKGRMELKLSPDGPGRYFADLEDIGAGIWRIEVTALNADNEAATAHKTLTW